MLPKLINYLRNKSIPVAVFWRWVCSIEDETETAIERKREKVLAFDWFAWIDLHHSQY